MPLFSSYSGQGKSDVSIPPYTPANAGMFKFSLQLYFTQFNLQQMKNIYQNMKAAKQNAMNNMGPLPTPQQKAQYKLYMLAYQAMIDAYLAALDKVIQQSN